MYRVHESRASLDRVGFHGLAPRLEGPQQNYIDGLIEEKQTSKNTSKNQVAYNILVFVWKEIFD